MSAVHVICRLRGSAAALAIVAACAATPAAAVLDGAAPAGAGSAVPVIHAQAVAGAVSPEHEPAPKVFEATGAAEWDGRRTLQGVWVAHPLAPSARRVRIFNTETGVAVDGALFKRDPSLVGPSVLISSEAAQLLGMEPGDEVDLRIVALSPVQPATSVASESSGSTGAAEPGGDAGGDRAEGASTPSPEHAVAAASREVDAAAATPSGAVPSETSAPAPQPQEPSRAAGAEAMQSGAVFRTAPPAPRAEAPAAAAETVVATDGRNAKLERRDSPADRGTALASDASPAAAEATLSERSEEGSGHAEESEPDTGADAPDAELANDAPRPQESRVERSSTDGAVQEAARPSASAAPAEPRAAAESPAPETASDDLARGAFPKTEPAAATIDRHAAVAEVAPAEPVVFTAAAMSVTIARPAEDLPQWGSGSVAAAQAGPSPDDVSSQRTTDAGEPRDETIMAKADAEPAADTGESASEPAWADQTGWAMLAAASRTDAAAPAAKLAAVDQADVTPAKTSLAKPYVQAGIFGVTENADRLIGQLKAADLPALGKPLTLNGRPAMRVLAGPFAAEADRDSALKTIREMGLTDATFVER